MVELSPVQVRGLQRLIAGAALLGCSLVGAIARRDLPGFLFLVGVAVVSICVVFGWRYLQSRKIEGD